MKLSSIERYESSVRSYVRSFPTVFATAEGAWLTNTEGRKYLDFFAGAGTLNYGHNNPLAKEALLSYISKSGVSHALDMATTSKIEFIEEIQNTILKPRQLDYRIQFTGPTGANAIEAALKLARKVKQRSHIVAFTNAYHGHSLGALSLTGNRYYHDEHYGSRNNVSHFPFDGYLGNFDTSALLEKMLADPSSGLPLPAAIVLETIQGEGGIRVANAGWLQRIAAICRKYDIFLIIDDIQVGNGRSGNFFSFEFCGLQPDIVCLSKAIGGGMPMAILLIRPECDQWEPGQHTGTFRGNNLAFVAGKALLEYWKDSKFQNDIATKSNFVRSALHAIASENAEHNWDVRGRGLVWGLDVGCGELACAISKTAFNRGLIVETCGAHDQVIKLLPPLTIPEGELMQGLQILSDSIAEVLNGTHIKALSAVDTKTDATSSAKVVTSLPIALEANQVLI